MRPLCPHCLRSGCEWVYEWVSGKREHEHGPGRATTIYGGPERAACPAADFKLAADVAKRLRSRIDAGVLVRLDFVPGDLVIDGPLAVRAQDFYTLPMSHKHGHGHRTEEGE